MPPIGNANFAWLQHMVYHLAPNGSLSTQTNNEGEIRKKMIEAGIIDCIVALQKQLFYNTGIPACIWFISRKNGCASNSREGEILFIDASEMGHMDIAKQISAFNARGSDLGLNNDELAFYDALASHSSIKDVFDDRKLFLISREVLESVRQNATIDWILKESAQARLRLAVKKILRKYGYPPYMEEDATKKVMQQAELFAREFTKSGLSHENH